MAKQTVAEKRDGEKLLVSEMIALYCRKNHHTVKGSLCREQIRTVMRWSGPRMLFVHPVLAIRHMKETMKAKKS